MKIARHLEYKFYDLFNTAERMSFRNASRFERKLDRIILRYLKEVEKLNNETSIKLRFLMLVLRSPSKVEKYITLIELIKPYLTGEDFMDLESSIEYSIGSVYEDLFIHPFVKSLIGFEMKENR
jgi:hypothetical protein